MLPDVAGRSKQRFAPGSPSPVNARLRACSPPLQRHKQMEFTMTTETFPRTVTAAELRLGDVVELFDGPFGTAIVRQIKDKLVTMFRPYGAHADTVYTGGLIPYTEVEDFNVRQDSTSTYKLWRHADHIK